MHFQQKILNTMAVGACQNQIAWFLGNNGALSKFKYRILHYLGSIIKLQNCQSVKANFILTT